MKLGIGMVVLIVLAVAATVMGLWPAGLLVAPALLPDLQAQRKDAVKKMRALAEKVTLTAEEKKQYDDLKAQVADFDGAISRLRETDSLVTDLAITEPVLGKPKPEGAKKGKKILVENPGFENVAEILYCSRFATRDPRYQALMEMGTGESGGIMVPDEFNATMLEVAPSEAIVRPRATKLPQMGSPDAALTMPVLQQAAAENMFGGVEVVWVAEGGTKTETDFKLKDVTLEPREVAAHIVVTDKLLRNWQGAGATTERLLRAAVIAAEDVAFLTGPGTTRPLGAFVAPCTKAVARQVANEVSYLDLCNMEAEFLDAPGGVWVVSKRAVRQLRIMEDNAGQLIWADPKGPIPGTLMGREVVVSFRSPALGSKGDVALCDFGKYLIRDGSAVQVAASAHVHFVNNKTVIKIFKTVDGAPWLDLPVEQEDGQTYSPFVVLDVPA